MSIRGWRTAIGALLVAGFALVGSPANARVIHDLSYDPPTGTGTLEVVNDACLFDDDVHCIINLLTTELTDSNGDHWILPGPVNDISPSGFEQNVDTTETHQLFDFDSIAITMFFDGSLELDALGFRPANSTCTATLTLHLGGTTSFTSDCTGVDDHGIYNLSNPRQVPEPGTLALLGGALGALWLRRRRNA